MCENEKRVTFMTTLAEASFLIRRIAEPVPAGDSAKAAITRACRRLQSWSWNRTKDVYYARQGIRVSADELKHLREVARIKSDEADRAEFKSIRERLTRLETALCVSDEAFHRESIAAVREQIAGLVGTDRAVDIGED